MKTQKKSKKVTIYIAIASMLAAAGVAGILSINGQDEKTQTAAVLPAKSGNVADISSLPAKTDIAADVSSEAGITIDKNAVTEEALFIPYQSGDIDMEVIAIRAGDGTVRTALNTCQVCYDSGRGYYKQEGDVLVCQNCGNRFTVDQVEVVKGGCNPVPISSADKTETEESITISDDVMADYSVLFSDWKR